MWPTTQNDSLCRMSSRIRSIIFGCGFISGNALFALAGIGFLEFFDDLKDAIAAHDRIIDDELKCGSVFENHGAADQALDALAMAGKQVEPSLLLVGFAQDADKNDCGMEVSGDINVVDGHEAGLVHRKLAANDFPDLPFKEFAHALKSKRGHRSSLVDDSRRRGHAPLSAGIQAPLIIFGPPSRLRSIRYCRPPETQ